MTTDKRKGWLAELTVGSLVIVSSRYGSRVVKVEKITPSGRITASRCQFNPDGQEIGHYGFWRDHLSEATPDAVAKIKAGIARDKVRSALRALDKHDTTALDAFIATLTDDQRKMLGVQQ